MTAFSTALRRFVLSAWFSAASLLCAQPPTSKAPPAQLITFCMIGGKESFVPGDADDRPAAFKFRADRVVHELNLTPGRVAGPFTRPAEAKILVYREQPAADPTKPPQFLPVAETAVDSSWRNIMVLVALNETTGGVTLTPLDQSLTTVPAGTLRFINLTQAALAVKLGATHGMVRPQGRVNLPCGLTGDQAQMVELRVAAEIEGEGRVVNSTSMALCPTDRRLALVYPGQIRAVQVLLLRPAPPDPVEPASGPFAAPTTRD